MALDDQVGGLRQLLFGQDFLALFAGTGSI
jgi:hypothetical protein